MSNVKAILLYILFFAIIYIGIFGIRSVYVLLKKVFRFFSERIPLLIDSVLDFAIKHVVELLFALLTLGYLLWELSRLSIFAYLLKHL